MPAIIEYRQEIFVHDDTVSTTTSAIPDNENYPFAASMNIIETSALVMGSFLMATPNDS